MGVKQVIVMRRDLKMRRGKEIAQGAHASMAFLSNLVKDSLDKYNNLEVRDLISPVQKAWIEGLFKKVCVQVHSEEELVAVAEKAAKEGVACNIITDSGLTEFNGVPTMTCLAIGPDEEEKVDKVTGDLKLY